MISNPELKRNLWSQCTLHKLIVGPLILFGVIVAIGMGAEESSTPFAWGSLLLFIAITGLWGSSLVSESIPVEVQSGTWPLQKLTPISPWTMTWGKILGASSYAWYLGIICLLTFFWALGDMPQHDLNALFSQNRILLFSLLISISLSGQSLALFLSFSALTHQRSNKKQQSIVVFIFLAFLFLSLFQGRPLPLVSWYGRSLQFYHFYLGTLLFLLFWVATGSYLLMRKELQLANASLGWMCFITSSNVYMMGFPWNLTVDNSASTLSQLIAGFILTWMLSYAALFWGMTNGIKVRESLLQWKEKRWRDWDSGLPRWIHTLLLLAILGMGITVYELLNSRQDWEGPPLNGLAWALFFFVLRDTALVLYFNFSKNPKPNLMAPLVYLAVLYGLIPTLLSLLGGSGWNFIFFPHLEASTALKIGAPFLEALLMAYFAIKRWRANFAKVH